MIIMTEKLALSALVRNRAGVLQRVVGLLARRGYNIQSLTVCDTENDDFSRMTIVAQVEPSQFNQVEQQILKLEDVMSIVRLTEENVISSELLLIKVHCVNKDRAKVLKTIGAYGARVKDIGHITITAELTGESARIDEFISAMSAHGIVELSRSGMTALESGDKAINEKQS